MNRFDNILIRKTGKKSVMAQRVTGFLLIPLGIWLSLFFLFLSRSSFGAARFSFSSLWVTFGSVVFLGVMFYHGYLGMRVIWEDYIPQEKACRILIFSTRWLSLIFTGSGILSLIRIYFFP